MSAAGVPVVDPGPSWVLAGQRVTPSYAQQLVEKDGLHVTALLERAVTGVFREAFPCGEHDLRLGISPTPHPASLTELLTAYAGQFAVLDPECRRLVFAAPEGDLAAIGAAEQAGFRYVVDVEVADGSYSLMVVEPEWVTAVDMDLDRVPQT